MNIFFPPTVVGCLDSRRCRIDRRVSIAVVSNHATIQPGDHINVSAIEFLAVLHGLMWAVSGEHTF